MEAKDHLILKNKKGNVIAWSFFMLSFIFIWAVWLGAFMQEWGATYITVNSATGIEAFFYANLNIWIGLALITSIFMYIRFGGQGN